MSTCLSWDCISKNPLLLNAFKLSLPQEKSAHDLEDTLKYCSSPKVTVVGYEKKQAQKCWQVPACPHLPVQHTALLPNSQFCWWDLRTPAVCRGTRLQQLSSPVLLHQLGRPAFPDPFASFYMSIHISASDILGTNFSVILYNSSFQKTLTSPESLDCVRSYSYHKVHIPQNP